MAETILKARGITRTFQQPDKSRLAVLENLDLELERNALISITGASGTGKSTLLHILGALDKPDKGEVIFEGEDIHRFNGKQKAQYRNRIIGFVFQFHYLMPELNVIENVSFPALMKEFSREQAFAQAEKLLEDVGLKDKLLNMPFQLSGGERQRVAIARSLINSPHLLLADEPTGNLDWLTGEKVFHLFRDLIKERNLTGVIVTHNEQLADLLDRRYHLHEGRLTG